MEGRGRTEEDSAGLKDSAGVQVRRKRQAKGGGGWCGSCLLRKLTGINRLSHDGVHSLHGRTRGSGNQRR